LAEAVIVIPARYGSTRFPGKPLARLWGKPVIEHVYRRAKQSRLCTRAIIATDDERIAAAARGFGAEVALTRLDHVSGTDRVAEVAEPLVDPGAIDAAVEPLAGDPGIPMGTLCAPLEEVEELANPNVVKVVLDETGFALYFSRLPIPFVRDPGAKVTRYRHIGLYVYRREFLLELAKMAPTPLEQTEKLEQLRVLERGGRIRVVVVPKASPGVDTPEDLERLERQPPQ